VERRDDRHAVENPARSRGGSTGAARGRAVARSIFSRVEWDATGVPRSGSTDLRVDGLQFRPVLSATPSMYEIVAAGFAGALVHIKQEGRVWVTRP
jgi:hypothetical protein